MRLLIIAFIGTVLLSSCATSHPDRTHRTYLDYVRRHPRGWDVPAQAALTLIPPAAGSLAVPAHRARPAYLPPPVRLPRRYARGTMEALQKQARRARAKRYYNLTPHW